MSFAACARSIWPVLTALRFEKCESELREQEEALSRFSDHEEVVLWFEHDLFCQVQLIYLLDWFARRELGQTKAKSRSASESFPASKVFEDLVS